MTTPFPLTPTEMLHAVVKQYERFEGNIGNFAEGYRAALHWVVRYVICPAIDGGLHDLDLTTLLCRRCGIHVELISQADDVERRR